MRFLLKPGLFGFLFLLLSGSVMAQQVDTVAPAPPPILKVEWLELQPPRLMRAGRSYDVVFTLSAAAPASGQARVIIQGRARLLVWTNRQGTFGFTPRPADESLAILSAGKRKTWPINSLDFPLWLAILPPLIAIGMALIFREVISALFTGIFIGAAILGVSNQGWTGIFSGFLAVLDEYLLSAITDPDHVAIILFSMLIGSMVAIISRNGGMQGLVEKISRVAGTAVKGQLATWLLGIAIFFDDYANTLVVGNTMRPVTDRLRISREKLAYLVDSTAAPVAALAFITTWIGAELGYIQDGVAGLPSFPQEYSAYSIFIASLGYSFYPILTLGFIVMVVLSQRDFGPMLKAERRARHQNQVKPLSSEEKVSGTQNEELSALPGIEHKAYNALLPVGVLILGVMAGLFYTGYDAGVWGDPDLDFVSKLSTTIGKANSYAALMWAALAAVTVAIGLSTGQKLMSLNLCMETVVTGFKTMLPAMVILIMAWGLQKVVSDIHTADFLTEVLADRLAPAWIPATTMVLAALVAFATGSSWGTMAILYPLMLPLAWVVSQAAGLPPEQSLPIFFHTVSAVLAGSVLGDHCSPISDTTILSSLASDCNHIEHVRTQLPYALVVGVASIIAGSVVAHYHIPSWMGFLGAFAILFLLVRFVGRRVDKDPVKST